MKAHMYPSRPIAIISLLLFSFSLSCAQQKELTILHTNDIHASFVPHEATWSRQTPKPMVGGFKELEFTIDSIRALKPNALLLDAGDVMTGNPVTEMEYAGSQGGALFAMMNSLKYDAWCPGNHDFDISQENLIEHTRIVSFPSLSANIVNTKNEFPVNNKEYVILEKAGLKIGVFGLMTSDLYGVVNQNNLVGIKVLSPVETAQKIIDKISGQTDLIIAVTHQGVSDDSMLAASVHGLNVIVGGHSHTRLTKPKFINDVVIVQTGARCENLGELNITVENHKIVKYEGRLIQLWAHDDRPTTHLSALVDSLQNEIDKKYSEVIAQLDGDWNREGNESNVGEFVVDAQREAARAQVGFTNAHGIRSNVSAGPLTKRELFEVLPFRNELVTFQLSGKQLKHVVVDALASDDPVVSSGIKATVKKNAAGAWEIVEMTIDGKPVDEDRMYVCAASDFFVGQAKKYIGVEVQQPIFLKHTIFQVVEDAARKAKVISTNIERRIERIK
jgi:5'-nucleotidase/UDP-sugar diphosphatase